MSEFFNGIVWRAVAVAAVVTLSVCMPGAVEARKVPARLVEGIAYLHSGERVVTVDSTRFAVPRGRRPLEVVVNAWTKRSRVGEKIEGTRVDSVVVWSQTSPERRHKLVFIDGYGWCWELFSTPYATLYAYSKHGYFVKGNGGMVSVKELRSLLRIRGSLTEFDHLEKMASRGWRERLCSLVSDDPVICKEIRASNCRRSKTLRMLEHYRPGV